MSLAEDRQITALCWGGVLLISLGSPSHIPQACAAPPHPHQGKTGPSPFPQAQPLAPRQHAQVTPDSRAPPVCLSRTHFLSSSCRSSCIPGLREGDRTGAGEAMETHCEQGGQLRAFPRHREDPAQGAHFPGRVNCAFLAFSLF